MATDTLSKIKLYLRRSHNKLDEDIQADIDACLADLRVCGVIYADETDPLIFNAIKLWCKSLDAEEPAEAADLLERYEALKACLMMAEGYGWKEDSND